MRIESGLFPKLVLCCVSLELISTFLGEALFTVKCTYVFPRL